MAQFMASLFQRDLLKLKEELNAFKDEANIWKTTPGITNSAGNLTLHLLGNINHFIGTTLGNTGYIRQRDLEFSTKNTARAELISGIDNAIELINTVLGTLTEQQLNANYPLEVFGKQSTSYYLVHFFGHINYHLGQVNYLRRFLEN